MNHAIKCKCANPKLRFFKLSRIIIDIHMHSQSNTHYLPCMTVIEVITCTFSSCWKKLGITFIIEVNNLIVQEYLSQWLFPLYQKPAWARVFFKILKGLICHVGRHSFHSFFSNILRKMDVLFPVGNLLQSVSKLALTDHNIVSFIFELCTPVWWFQVLFSFSTILNIF